MPTTPRGFPQLSTDQSYALVADYNRLGVVTDAALTAVEDGAIAYADQVGQDTRDSIVLPSVNLYNWTAAGQAPGNALRSDNGLLTATPSYDVTHYIPIGGGTTYTIGGGMVRSIAQYDASQKYLGYPAGWVDNADYSTETITTKSDAAFLRITVTAGTLGGLMVVEGATLPTSYVPYGASGLAPDLDVLVQGRIDAVRDAVEAESASGVTVTRSGQSVTIARTIGDKPLTEQVTLRDTKNNRAFQFGTVTYDGGVLTHATDDVTPIRTQAGTVGGNHGMLTRSYANPDGKTAADVGSVWSDGTREYVLFAMEATGRLVMAGPPATNSAGVVYPWTGSATGPLTHVSGATHTGTIDHTTTAVTQLWPYVTRQDVRLFIDGSEVTADETRTGANVEVHESYQIIDYGDLWAQARANVGKTVGSYPVAGAVQVETVYRWTPAGACEVTTDYIELLPTILNAAGGVQAQAHDQSGDRRWRSIPGVGTVGGVDWTVGVDASRWSSSVIITAADLTGPQPPLVGLERVQAGGATTVGFAIGYKPDTRVADSDSPARLEHATTNLWDVRSNHKHYPTAWANRAPAWGHLRICGWRAYLSAADADRVAEARTSTGAWAAVAAATGMGGTA